MRQKAQMLVTLLLLLLGAIYFGRQAREPNELQTELPTRLELKITSWSCTSSETSQTEWQWNGENYETPEGFRLTAERMRSFLGRLEPDQAVPPERWAARVVTSEDFSAHRPQIFEYLKESPLLKVDAVAKRLSLEDLERDLTLEATRDGLIERQEHSGGYVGTIYQLSLSSPQNITKLEARYFDGLAINWAIDNGKQQWSSYDIELSRFITRLEPKAYCDGRHSEDIWDDEFFWKFDFLRSLAVEKMRSKSTR